MAHRTATLAQFEALLSDRLATLAAAPVEQLDAEITATLRALCQLLAADRSTVWRGTQREPRTLRAAHIHADAAFPEAALAWIANERFPWITAQLLEGRTVSIPDVSAMPAEAPLDRENLTLFGARSTLVVPFTTGRSAVCGALSFSATTELTTWSSEATAHARLVTQVINSALVRAESDRAASEERARLRTIIDSTPSDLIWCVEPERFGLITWNRAFARFFMAVRGVEVRAGDTPEMLFNPASPYPPRWRAFYERALREGAYSIEYDTESNGRPLRMQLEFNLVQKGDERIGVSVFGRDVTEQTLNDERLRNLARAVEQAPVSVIITDTAGTIQYVNPKFSEVTGYAPHEVMGQNPRVLKSGETPQGDYGSLWSTITAGREWRGEFHNRRKDGSLFWERAVISGVRDASGRITHFVAVKEDATEEKRALAELARVHEQFLQAQKMEAIGRLAGGVAHDFNNLLTVICAFSADLIEQLGDAHPHAADLHEILKAGEQAASLTQQLLSFSRQQPRRPRVVDLTAVVRDSEKLLRRVIGEDVRLLLGLGVREALVLADPAQLHQVILNLVVNARDAMPHGGELFIEVSEVVIERAATLPGGRYVTLSVRDTGEGIAPSLMPRIFEPFFTTKERGKGTGLGLSTVRDIVQQSDGDIDIESAPGLGTRVVVRLPRVDAAGADERARDEDLLRGHETVLVVDDDAHVRAVLERMLRRCGYEVLLAASGAQALSVSAAREGAIDLLVTDVVMPSMSGVQLARALRSARPDTAVLFTTGFTDLPPEEFEELSDAPVLQKPYTLRAVSAAVRAALVRRAA